MLIRPNETLYLKYLLFYFRYFEAQLQQKGTGTTFKAITQDIIKNLEIPVPPLEDQQRIVTRIEELFSQLDSGVETLKKTKEQLKVYRQAVLKEAFEGRYSSINSFDITSTKSDYDRIRKENVVFKDVYMLRDLWICRLLLLLCPQRHRHSAASCYHGQGEQFRHYAALYGGSCGFLLSRT